MSSKNDCAETPDELYQCLDMHFRFNLDVAADYNNRKCVDHIDAAADALKTRWPNNARIWCHAPQSMIQSFAQRCSETQAITVLLAPMRTDTKWWLDYLQDKADHIIFLKRRLRWKNGGNAWEPYCLAIYNLPNLPSELKELGLVISPRNSTRTLNTSY